MFNNLENTSPLPLRNINCKQNYSQHLEKTLQIKLSHSKESREQKMSRIRQMNQIGFIAYEGVNYEKFAPLVENQANTYTLLATIFTIADNFTWRQYLSHLEILIKKITNLIEASKGKVLEEINSKYYNEKLGNYNFQQRIECLLRFSSKQLQMHMLIFVHAMVAYNKRYCLLDEARLSEHLARRHSYQKYIREDVIWLLTRMSLSSETINKITKNYLQNTQNSPLLPVLTIFANFIYEQPQNVILQFIESAGFQKIVENGLNSSHFETEREASFICNNLIFKSNKCFAFISNQQNLIRKIKSLSNQQAQIFKVAIERSQGRMEEQHN